MSYVVTLSGSPAAFSRSTHLLTQAEAALRSRGVHVRRIDARALPPVALMHAHADDPAVREALAIVDEAQAVIVATPLYKASYSGLLKSFLDLLPQSALLHKPVLPLATGGSLAHLLALDYALKPVLSALGARHVLDNVFATELDVVRLGADYVLDDAIAQRLAQAVDSLLLVLDDAAALRRMRCGPAVHNEVLRARIAA
jgi:FMN reductase